MLDEYTSERLATHERPRTLRDLGVIEAGIILGSLFSVMIGREQRFYRFTDSTSHNSSLER